ncbi:cellobiose dehydrogenase-like protein [Delitschia confertaspora ATCC 74209]|uniref:Cellobiose dehydrogenase-like protein n=1 Tax=Delitschia confertaspora ATCC 74209 TaxID=1513339 RepID=A0A9P4JNB5_9PLEO|nr:cellobiose dehydrogenase-like protein [Delitschia confertaspora ATCC 74209]
MRFSRYIPSVAALIGVAAGQTGIYCDSVTSLCFSSYSVSNILIGVAIPNATVAPYDVVLQIVAPISIGWVGFSWGGTMPYVPLTVGWINKAASTTIYSSRMALGLTTPIAYDGAEYTYLKGTGYNSTHWTLTVRCRGCSEWEDPLEGNSVSLDPNNKTLPFAHAFSSKVPIEPAKNTSAFSVHSNFGHWTLDLSSGRNADFDKLVAANLIQDAPPVNTTTSIPPTTTTTPGTTLTTGVIPTTTTTRVPCSCAGVNSMKYNGTAATGWKFVKVAGNLMGPRSIVWDTAGNLLVVENGKGITGYTVGPDGCLGSSKSVIAKKNLNHGLVISPDGKTLYASSATTVWSWTYDPATMTVGEQITIVTGMDSKGHVTRSLVIPPKHPNLLLVSHGSNDNMDWGSIDMKTGRACVKVFDTSKTPSAGYNYASGGYQMGYGLRNEVGLAFDGNGMLWGVENSSDEVRRITNGKSLDIHVDNPGEKLNYLGDPTRNNTQWYGYPTCYAVWKPSDITDRKFARGDQFVMEPNSTFNDNTCKTRSTPPKMVMQAHSAPLDAQFNKDYSAMYITFHGSWNRDPTTGYKVVQALFQKDAAGNYGPVADLSQNGYTDLFWNSDLSKCSTTYCFRPVSIAVDRFGRFYVSSDAAAEGEIFLLGKA